jgi:hypothetical protein
MAPETIDLQPGDPCPVCGGPFAPARRLTPADWLRLFDKENPQPVPDFTDTLHPDKVQDLGALHICTRCRYKTRFAGENRPRVDSRGDRSLGAGRDARDDASRREATAQRDLEASRRRIAELEAERARSQDSPPG